MGFTAELVRSVFSRNRSINSRESKVRSNGVEKRGLVSMKSYLCSDEVNSVLGEEDSGLAYSSGATVRRPTEKDIHEKSKRSEETAENIVTEKKRPNSKSKLLNEEEAAILIQSAYRVFLHRRKSQGKLRNAGKKEEPESPTILGQLKSSDWHWQIGSIYQMDLLNQAQCLPNRESTRRDKLNFVKGSPNRKSVDTSIEVQIGNPAEVFPVEAENISIRHPPQHTSKTQVIKQKEDWDDSTVSSYVSKMRMQNRMEATTRRERALAYAFSQQLRICSTRKPNKYNNIEANMGWSWLERWMATRFPDKCHATKQHDVVGTNQRLAMRKRLLDIEKESCGSNEVPLHFDDYSTTSKEVKDHDFTPTTTTTTTTTTKNNLKARRIVSRRKTVPSYQLPEEHLKVSKRDSSSNSRKNYRQKEKQVGSRREMNLNT